MNGDEDEDEEMDQGEDEEMNWRPRDAASLSTQVAELARELDILKGSWAPGQYRLQQSVKDLQAQAARHNRRINALEEASTAVDKK